MVDSIDHRLPGSTNLAGKYQFTPKVDEQRAVDIPQQVVRDALAQCHLVAAGTLPPVAQVEGCAGSRPVQAEREGHGREGVADGQPL